MTWTIYAAASTGVSHLDAGLPCQDAYAFHDHGELLLAAVCDGAGSQPRSDAGARLTAEDVVSGLAALANWPPLASIDEASIRAELERAIAGVRESLATKAASCGAELSHYACTLVGALADRSGGWLFQIGDGAALATDHAAGQTVARSGADNGEYANETWFVTGDEWASRLRLTRFDRSVGLVALMTDGAMPFVLNKAGDALYAPFIGPVLKFLDGVDAATGSKALAGTLGDPRTHQITPDDKTLLLARWR